MSSHLLFDAHTHKKPVAMVSSYPIISNFLLNVYEF